MATAKKDKDVELKEVELQEQGEESMDDVLELESAMMKGEN